MAGNDRGAPVTQEQEHHDDGEQGTFDHGRHRALILRLGIIDAVEESREFDTWIFFFDLGDFHHRIIKDRDVGRAFCTGHAECDDLFATCKRHRALLAVAVGDFGDVGKFDVTPAAQTDLGLAQSEGVGGVPENTDGLARSRDLRLAARCVDILLAQDAVDLACSDAERLHLGRVEDNANFAVHTAVTADRRHAFDRQ